MPYYKFKENDVFYNRVKTYPEVKFWIYNGKSYYNNVKPEDGTLNTSTILNHVPTGNISLYELNVDRPSGDLIYPFVSKNSSLGAFKTVSLNSFNTGYNYGDEIAGEYPLSATISKERWAAGAISLLSTPTHLEALETTLDYYKPMSDHYAYNSYLGDKSSQEVGLVTIPSIFYGSSIKKGSVYLRMYVTGTLAAELHDREKNGELIEVTSSKDANLGKVAGVVLYNEGFFVLTGSWDISDHTEGYVGSATEPKWTYFAQSLVAGANSTPSSSFGFEFKGTNYIPTITMMAHANKGQVNHSNNPTYILKEKNYMPTTGSSIYKEYDKREIKNIVSGAYCEQTASFQKQTYISKIGIYDDDKKLIAVAKLANPVRKREMDEYTFKLKLDI